MLTDISPSLVYPAIDAVEISLMQSLQTTSLLYQNQLCHLSELSRIDSLGLI
jgi:hypothetical protein